MLPPTAAAAASQECLGKGRAPQKVSQGGRKWNWR